MILNLLKILAAVFIAALQTTLVLGGVFFFRDYFEALGIKWMAGILFFVAAVSLFLPVFQLLISGRKKSEEEKNESYQTKEN